MASQSCYFCLWMCFSYHELNCFDLPLPSTHSGNLLRHQLTICMLQVEGNRSIEERPSHLDKHFLFNTHMEHIGCWDEESVHWMERISLIYILPYFAFNCIDYEKTSLLGLNNVGTHKPCAILVKSDWTTTLVNGKIISTTNSKCKFVNRQYIEENMFGVWISNLTSQLF